MTKKMLVLSFFCWMVTGFALGQSVYKLKAREVAYKVTDDRNRWTKWTDWKDCNILVVIDIDDDKVTIYSSKTQEFDIINYEDKEYDAEGVETFEMTAIDHNGKRCTIRQRMTKTARYTMQLYIDYSDAMFVYNLEPS